MKKHFIFILFLTLFLVGCSSGGGTQGQAKEETKGDGLQINFEVDDTYLPELSYTLVLDNKGEKKVELTMDSLLVTTLQKTTTGDSVLSAQSLAAFKQNIFKKGNLVLSPNEKKTYKGTLSLDEKYYTDLTKNNVDIYIYLDYLYETQFNSELTLNKGDFSAGSIVQAAPLKVNSITPYYSPRGDKIIYELRRANNNLEIQNIETELTLGTYTLNCQLYLKEDSSFERVEQDYRMTDSSGDTYIGCDTDFSRFDDSATTITKTFGILRYSVEHKISTDVSFPQKRSLGFDNY